MPSFNADAQNSDTTMILGIITNETNSSYVIAFPFSLGKQIAESIGPIGGTYTSVLTSTPNSSNIVTVCHFQSGVYAVLMKARHARQK